MATHSDAQTDNAVGEHDSLFRLRPLIMWVENIPEDVLKDLSSIVPFHDRVLSESEASDQRTVVVAGLTHERLAEVQRIAECAILCTADDERRRLELVTIVDDALIAAAQPPVFRDTDAPEVLNALGSYALRCEFARRLGEVRVYDFDDVAHFLREITL